MVALSWTINPQVIKVLKSSGNSFKNNNKLVDNLFDIKLGFGITRSKIFEQFSWEFVERLINCPRQSK